MSSEPTTQSGRALFTLHDQQGYAAVSRANICDIEAEARAAALAEPLDVAAVAFALHRLLNHSYHGGGWDNADGDLAYSFMDHYEHAPTRVASPASEDVG